MENAYGIGVANRYALFLDEAEDPLEVLKVQEQEREAKKKTKLSEKENKGKAETKGKSAQVPRKGIKETQNVKPVDPGKAKEENNKAKAAPPRPVSDRPERNVKFAGESREERNNRRNREDNRPFAGAGEFSRENRESARTDGEIRGRGRGVGGGSRGVGRGRGVRGGGRGGYDSRGKREFDRQSGSDKTGVKSIDKRDGAGAHNWGTHKDEIEVQLQSNRLNDDSNEWSEKADEQQQQHPAEPTEAKESDTSTPVAEENAQPAEEEPRELTLDEYYAMRGSRQKPTYNIRKAGEGEDLTQWKKMYELKKKDGEEEEEEEEEYDASEYPQRVGRQKHLLDIDIHFADSRRGTRGRGRGGMRGMGRGRGGGGGGGSGGSSSGGGGNGSGGNASGSGGGSVGSAVSGLPRGPGESRFGDRPDREPYQRIPRQQQSAPKVDDEHDFPSLG